MQIILFFCALYFCLKQNNNYYDIVLKRCGQSRSLKKYKIPPDLIVYLKDDTPSLKYKDVEVPLGKTVEYTPKIERLCQILKSLNNMKGVLHLDKWNSGDSNIIFEKTQ